MTDRIKALRLFNAIRETNPKLSPNRILLKMADICPSWPVTEWGTCFACANKLGIGPLCDSCAAEADKQTINAAVDAIASVPPPKPPVGMDPWHRYGSKCFERRYGKESLSALVTWDGVDCPECLAEKSAASVPPPKPHGTVYHWIGTECVKRAGDAGPGPTFHTSDPAQVNCLECAKELSNDVHLGGRDCYRRDVAHRHRQTVMTSFGNQVTCPECLHCLSPSAGVRESMSPEARLSVLETRVDALSQRMNQQDTRTRKYGG